MFQNAFHIALCSKCDRNVKAGVSFEAEIIQKIDRHLITVFFNTTVLQMHWIFI